ncbi:MAG: heavy metal-associated domain-containing protein [Pseudomonadota bacterium]|nr:heavy metal-associated domain-containing protein [Pseudomonadota bacterium]
MDTMTLEIDGMSCGGCVLSVEKALGRVEGVTKVVVSLETKRAVVEGKGLDRQRLADAVTDAGYDVR